MNARVTVCIPAYKNPAYLRDALTCLCDQGLGRDEYVVAVSEDPSETSLEPVAVEFARKLTIEHSRSEQRLGHLGNFERAVGMARTPLISILPHDDVIAPGQLARVVPLLENHPGAVMAGSRVVCQRFPGAPDAHLQGNLVRPPANPSFLEPFVWSQVEWMASAMVGTPLSMVGAVFSTDAFRRCERWKSFPMWHDRVWCAELGAQGAIVSSPWVGGYYRVSESQLSAQLARTNTSEFRQVSQFVVDLCESTGFPPWIFGSTISAILTSVIGRQSYASCIPPCPPRRSPG